MKPLIPIVNDNDKIIGYKPRDDRNTKDMYRVSALWITNSKGDILLAQRAFTKKHNPLKTLHNEYHWLFINIFRIIIKFI